MKEKLIKMVPYLGIILAAIYLIPLYGKDTGSFILILLYGVPFVVLLVSIVYGANKGFNPILSLLVGLLFIPSIFTYYNSSAFIYVLIYTGVSLIGQILGIYVFRKK